MTKWLLRADEGWLFSDMDERGAQWEARFFLIFGAWFNVDLVDLRDRAVVMQTARVCAADLAKEIPDPQQLVNHLSSMLSSWHSQIALHFIEATDTDWLFDKETEQLLQDILKEIIATLRTFQSR
jgi:hypothetical protein